MKFRQLQKLVFIQILLQLSVTHHNVKILVKQTVRASIAKSVGYYD